MHTRNAKDYKLGSDFYVETDLYGYNTLRYKGKRPHTIDEAIDITYRKWEIEVAHPELKSGGNLTCGLCMIYTNRRKNCSGCPIMEYTGEAGCKGTPYIAFVNTSRSKKKKRRKLARQELKFLRTVLGEYLDKGQRTIDWGPHRTTSIQLRVEGTVIIAVKGATHHQFWELDVEVDPYSYDIVSVEPLTLPTGSLLAKVGLTESAFVEQTKEQLKVRWKNTILPVADSCTV